MCCSPGLNDYGEKSNEDVGEKRQQDIIRSETTIEVSGDSVLIFQGIVVRDGVLDHVGLIMGESYTFSEFVKKILGLHIVPPAKGP